MNKMICFILLLAVLPHPAFAGHGTIRETDSQIIVEYEGDANEVIAANIIKAKEDQLKKQAEQLKEQKEKEKSKEVARIKKMAENHARQMEMRRKRNKDGYDD